MRSVVICINGVLRPAARPDSLDPMGRHLYESLKSGFRVLLLDDGASPDTKHWLDVHSFIGHIGSYTPPKDFAPRTVAEGRLRMLAALRASQGADLVIESDPSCAAEEIRAGYNVMLYAAPQYMLDIWHPDHARIPRAWDSIVDELDRQQNAKATDVRLNDLTD